jgi:hypothetical protein
MSKNRENNKKALDAYRKQLNVLFEDIRDIDVKILNKAVNIGLADVKKNTPDRTGFMRKSWRSAPAVKRKGGGVSKAIVNSADYSSFVNNGHRIVKNGATVGWVKGRFMLEHAVKVVEKELSKSFKSEVERVNKKNE